MTICFVSHSARMGGAEKVLVETVEVLTGLGINCRVLLPEAGELCEEMTKLGIPFRIIPYGLWMSQGKQHWWTPVKSVLRLLATLPAILWAVRQWRCDIVYTNTITVCAGAIAALILGRPHVWHLHEFGYEDHGLVFFFGKSFSYKIVDSLSSACIVVSKALKLKYEQYIIPSKLTVIYPSMHRAQLNDAAPDCFEACIPARKERFRGIIVGSLTEGKRQEDVVRAMTNLARNGDSVEILIVGGGDQKYRERLEEIVRLNHLEGRATFIGKVANAIPFIQRSDAMIVCSESEAFGRVTIEAMLAGKPVIGARSGATPELIKEGYNGLLYKSGDPNDLAVKIKYLYDNPSLTLRLGQNGKRWAEEHFTKVRYGDEIVALLAAIQTSKIRARSQPTARP